MTSKNPAEIQELLSWLGKPPRSPAQICAINECDSEILNLGNGTFLAATTDAIAEEIQTGLYQDPYTMGWMAAMASLSDLAACGARPLGLLIASEWGPEMKRDDKQRATQGIADAVLACETFLLGGDTGHSGATVLTGTALGLCDSQPLCRTGIKPGDILCTTGLHGIGPALGLRFLNKEPEADFPESLFRPVAQTQPGIALRSFAHAAMDTSDGLLSTLDTLSLLNGIGFDLDWKKEILHPHAQNYCTNRKIPLFLLWAAELGDLQLITAISPEQLHEAQTRIQDLIPIGKACHGKTSRLKLPDGQVKNLDLSFARNLLHQKRDDLRSAFRELTQLILDLGLP